MLSEEHNAEEYGYLLKTRRKMKNETDTKRLERLTFTAAYQIISGHFTEILKEIQTISLRIIIIKKLFIIE